MGTVCTRLWANEFKIYSVIVILILIQVYVTLIDMLVEQQTTEQQAIPLSLSQMFSLTILYA